MIFAIFIPSKVSAAVEDDVMLMLSPALVSDASASDDCVMFTEIPSRVLDPPVATVTSNLSVGAVVPIPT